MLINGTNRIFYIKWEGEFLPIGCQTSDSFDETSKFLNTTTRDNAGWETSVPTNQSYSMSVDALVINTEFSMGESDKISLDRLRILKRARTLIEWQTLTEEGLFIDSGEAYIENLSDSSNIDEYISFTVSFKGYGQPTSTSDNGNPFIIEVTTTTPSETFTIPTTGTGYDYSTFTSDGQSTTGNTGDTTITFATAGTYDIEIRGSFPRIYFNNTGDKDKINEVKQWGIYGAGQLDQTAAFYGCSNLTEIANDCDNLNLITNGGNMFRSCTSLIGLPSTLTLDALTGGTAMFSNTTFTSLPSGMTLSNVISTLEMFVSGGLTSLPDGLTLASVTNGRETFNGCNLTDISNCTSMTLSNLTIGFTMFSNNALTDLPPNLTLTNLIDGTFMFNGGLLTDLPSSITLASLTTAINMFSGSTINTTRYSQLLIDMESDNPNDNVPFHGGNSEYNAGAVTARANLTARGWTITDGGLE